MKCENIAMITCTPIRASQVSRHCPLAIGLLLFLVLCPIASPQINIEVGDLVVNFTYLGAPPSAAGADYRLVGTLLTLSGQFARDRRISSGDDAMQMSQIPIGDYNFHVGFVGRPVGPLVPVTINTAQTTVIDVDLSGIYGQVTGTLLVNGQPGGSVSLAVVDSNGLFLDQVGASGTPPNGAFSTLLPAGNGSGTAFPGAVTIPSFTVVAGQNTNLVCCQ